MEIGKEIKRWGYDWYIIDSNEETTVLMMKDVLSEEEIKKYTNDKIMLYEKYVRYSDNIRCNEWNKSFIFILLNGEFLKQNPDLAEEINEIRLPKKEEIESLEDYKIRGASTLYWTCTPYEDNDDSRIRRAFSVYSYGDLGDHFVDSGGAVRPAVTIATSTLQTKKDGGENLFGEKNIPDKFEFKEVEDAAHYEIKAKINEIIDYLRMQNKEK